MTPTFIVRWPTLEGKPDPEATASVIGVTVAIAGNVLISLALNCQKLAHRRLELQLQPQQKRNSADLQSPSSLDSDRPQDGHDGRSLDWEERTRVEHEQEFDSHVWSRTGASASEEQPLLSPSIDLTRSYTSNSARQKSQTKVPPLIRWAGETQEDPSPADERETGEDSKSGEDEDGQDSHYLKSKLWWLGFILMNIGELGNFISYAFAPASVVAPLGTFALIANCFFAPIMLGERFRGRDLLGVMIAIVGAVTVVLASQTSDVRLSPEALIEAISQTPFIIYSGVYIAAALFLVSVSNTRWGDEWVFVDVGICALFGGFTVLSTKGLSSMLTLQWFVIFTSWITYPLIFVLVATGVGQIKYLNRALMKFDSKLVIPSQFVLFNLSAIVGSAILYGDFRHTTFHQMLTFLYGCAATFCGVFLIAWSSPTSDDEGDELQRGSRRHSAERLDSRPPVPLERLTNAVLVVPSSAKATPVLRHHPSGVSLGLSPAHRLLIVHNSTPPREGLARRHSLVLGSSDGTPRSASRTRAISWINDDREASPWAEGSES